MKRLLILTLLVALGISTTVFAATTTPGVFTLSATVPAATDVTYKVSKVLPGPPITFTPVASGSAAALTWATSDLSFNTTDKIWTGKHFYAIDLAPSVGVNGTPAPGNFGAITFNFTGETVPTGQTAGDGLSKRAVMQALKVIGTTETSIRGPERLGLVSALSPIAQADIGTGYLRVYVSLYTGLPVVTGAVPITNSDKAGAYGGTLTITATLI